MHNIYLFVLWRRWINQCANAFQFVSSASLVFFVISLFLFTKILKLERTLLFDIACFYFSFISSCVVHLRCHLCGTYCLNFSYLTLLTPINEPSRLVSPTCVDTVRKTHSLSCRCGSAPHRNAYKTNTDKRQRATVMNVP